MPVGLSEQPVEQRAACCMACDMPGARARAPRSDRAVSRRTAQSHYFRMTRDNRILWGGYDAVYHFGRGVRASYDNRPETFDVLARQFFETFPQLRGLR